MRLASTLFLILAAVPVMACDDQASADVKDAVEQVAVVKTDKDVLRKASLKREEVVEGPHGKYLLPPAEGERGVKTDLK